jgi:hypothetical protein
VLDNMIARKVLGSFTQNPPSLLKMSQKC